MGAMPPTSLIESPPHLAHPSRWLEGKCAPTGQENRILSVDALRGFALLGILTVNIQSFAMASGDHWAPTAPGDVKIINLSIWIVTHVLADAKFMAIFSMLFGAGILLMTQRLEARGVSSGVIHYRRMGILVLFGLAHAYLLWSGDILVAYGICGSLAYLFRKLSAAKLLTTAFFLLACGTIVFWAYTHPPAYVFSEAVAILREALGVSRSIGSTAETLAYRGPWLAQMSVRIQSSLETEFFTFAVVALWRVTGLMLAGMALMKSGFLTASHSDSVYRAAVGIGCCAGIPLTLFGTYRHYIDGWAASQGIFLDYVVNYWASLLVSVGWIGALMLLTQLTVFARCIRALAALGRTALSNYLLQTVVCIAIFFGNGFGKFGRMDRLDQALVVIAIWIAELILSALWLRRFRFGPMEWIWRSLTYMKREPFLRHSVSA
jgi:uncharacterized protein